MISRKKMDTAIKFGFVKHQIRLEFYILTKIHKPTPVGRPIVSGCDGPTEKLSSFVDKLLQAILQQQKSYLKDITDFINYRENTKVPEESHTCFNGRNEPLNKYISRGGNTHGMQSIRNILHKQPPIPTQLLEQALRLILQENSFQFYGKTTFKHMVQPKARKWQSPFLIIFMNKVESEILSQSELKPLIWKRFIADIFSL